MKRTKLGSSWAAIRPLIGMLFLGLMVCGAVEAQSVIVKPTKTKPNKTTVHRTAPKPKPTVRRHAQTSSTPQRLITSSDGEGGFIVKGVHFKMVKVDGGTFRMGATSEQGSDAERDESPVHSVTLSGYYIGQTEVTQALWEAVMGSNPSYSKGPQKPVEWVSWIDCQDFISKLNSLTGKHFRLPTEAEWEFAARGGNNSRGYKYSGGGYPDDVAWYTGNCGNDGTHDVGTKSANELGLYDMSGNVWEWCSDWKGDYDSGSQTNPRGAESGSYRVNRGGGWFLEAKRCRVSYRDDNTPDYRLDCIGLRLALSVLDNKQKREVSQIPITSDGTGGFAVGGVNFKMVKVIGGSFLMGATKEQGRKAESDEKFVHSVTLSDYYIGQTEVTQALWEAVMGSNPSLNKGAQKPVEQVSWNDCQEFFSKLNSLTGKQFRLPTEAEWEFAARGGNMTKGYKYSGSGKIDDVAWYTGNSGSRTHDVGTKLANELGLYDMSGNVWEWCSDWEGSYDSGSQTNPRGAESGSYRVIRGGGWNYEAECCRVSNRGRSTPDYRINYIGLRLALSVL